MAKIIKRWEALEQRFPRPEYALFYEVANATGFAAKRRADAIAMSLYPSRGLGLIGFEFKIQRSDWLRELDNPQKAEDMIESVDRWYVVSAQGVVKKNEVPSTWGWLRAQKDGSLRLVEPAPQIREPRPVSREFLAAILRRADEYGSDQSEVAKARREGFEAGRKKVMEQARDIEESSREIVNKQVE